MPELIIYCDGGARGNPGPGAGAFIVEKEGKIIFKGSKYLGKTTNNTAEYQAVILALTWLIKNQNEPPLASSIFQENAFLLFKWRKKNKNLLGRERVSGKFVQLFVDQKVCKFIFTPRNIDIKNFCFNLFL